MTTEDKGKVGAEAPIACASRSGKTDVQTSSAGVTSHLDTTLNFAEAYYKSIDDDYKRIAKELASEPEAPEEPQPTKKKSRSTATKSATSTTGTASLTWNSAVIIPAQMRDSLPFKHKDKLTVQIVGETVVISKFKEAI